MAVEKVKPKPKSGLSVPTPESLVLPTQRGLTFDMLSEKEKTFVRKSISLFQEKFKFNYNEVGTYYFSYKPYYDLAVSLKFNEFELPRAEYILFNIIYNHMTGGDPFSLKTLEEAKTEVTEVVFKEHMFFQLTLNDIKEWKPKYSLDGESLIPRGFGFDFNAYFAEVNGEKAAGIILEGKGLAELKGIVNVLTTLFKSIPYNIGTQYEFLAEYFKKYGTASFSALAPRHQDMIMTEIGYILTGYGWTLVPAYIDSEGKIQDAIDILGSYSISLVDCFISFEQKDFATFFGEFSTESTYNGLTKGVNVPLLLFTSFK